jgi:hypothetical protein
MSSQTVHIKADNISEFVTQLQEALARCLRPERATALEVAREALLRLALVDPRSEGAVAALLASYGATSIDQVPTELLDELAAKAGAMADAIDATPH